MKIAKIKAINYPPLTHFEIEDLGDIVIIAGANGSGKSRLKEAIVNSFQNPESPQIEILVQSTRPDKESKIWNTELIELRTGRPNQVFSNYMKSRTRGGTHTGSIIQIDSDRSVAPVKFQPIDLSTPDPDDIEIENTYFLNQFQHRWPDIVNKIFQKVANRNHGIAQYVRKNPKGKNSDALKRFPDPFKSYQKIFSKLLPGKTLEPIDAKNLQEFHFRQGKMEPLIFSKLSSGEQEVVRIAFTLNWKKIRHCIILVDEPELHLHPTLAFRLIETIKNIGDNTNQFIFFTHSSDLISTYYSSGNVFFISNVDAKENQARRLSILNENHIQTARALGNQLGLFAVGKNLVFVEGENASMDRITYNKIAQLYFSNAYVVPTGSVENINALNRLSKELRKSIFGIDFFMVRDRDGLTDAQVDKLEMNPRIKCLKRRHIENYFLDENILASVAKNFYLDDSWRDPKNVSSELKKIAESVRIQSILLAIKQLVTLNGTIEIPRVSNVQKKTIQSVKKEFTSVVNKSLNEVKKTFSKAALEQKFNQEYKRSEESLNNGTWKITFPGKLIFSIYCGKIEISQNRVREAYLDIALKNNPKIFADIQKTFEKFKKL
ncbi:MAG: ATP-binding protein [Bacteroidetes bacterium]|nr:ATP-binding protein [Bacteroidota bacterium]